MSIKEIETRLEQLKQIIDQTAFNRKKWSDYWSARNEYDKLKSELEQRYNEL